MGRYAAMSGYVCTIAGGKGGVGKTTTAINVGVVFEERGHDVVVVDGDLGMANLGQLLGVDYAVSLHGVLAGEATVSEGLTTGPGELTVVPGEQSLEAFAEADPAKLRKVIKTLRNAFDVVLVDTGAGLSHEVTVPLGLADGILMVSTPDDVAVADTIKTADLAERVDGVVIGGTLTRVTRDADVAAIAERFPFPTLGVVPEDPAATGDEPLVLDAPESPTAEAYRGLAGVLAEIFFEGVDGADVERVVEADWFADDEAAADEAEAEEEEESGGVFGLFR